MAPPEGDVHKKQASRPPTPTPAEASSAEPIMPVEAFFRLNLNTVWKEAAGHSPFEILLENNPVTATIFQHLSTPDLIRLRATSKTVRQYVGFHPRFLANLVLVRKGHEAWQPVRKPASGADPEDMRGREMRNLPEVLIRVLVEAWDDEPTPAQRKAWYQDLLWHVAAAVKARNCGKHADPYWTRCLEHCMESWSDPLEERESKYSRTEGKRPAEDYYPKLMGRHLLELLLTRLPSPMSRGGQVNLASLMTTLVLDGTGVDTESLKRVLTATRRTLKGLSVKWCPNIECFVYSEWLLEDAWDGGNDGSAQKKHKNPKLEWLSIWGSGTFQWTFNYQQQLPPVTPPTPHPDDCIPPFRSPYPPCLFPNYCKIKHLFYYVLDVLIPQHLCGKRRLFYMKQIRRLVRKQWEDEDAYRKRLADAGMPPCPDNATPQQRAQYLWDCPAFPFGDPHPLIALLALAPLFRLKLDFGLCANTFKCYSYLTGPQHPPSAAYGVGQHIIYQEGQNYQSYLIPYPIERPEDPELHTHTLAEVGGRRERGGRRCCNCNLWEDEPAPPEHCKGQQTTERGGVTFGPGIGIGRRTIGSLCEVCVRNMTCQGCGKFYCASCLWLDTEEEYPLAIERWAKVLQVSCANHIHGPHCMECTSGRRDLFFTCDTCDEPICLQCCAPTGLVAGTDLYGTFVHETAVDGRIYELGDDPVSNLRAFHPSIAALAKEENKDDPEVQRAAQEDDAYPDRITPAISLLRTFDICPSCDRGACADCLGYFHDAPELENAPNDLTSYITCRRCDRRFCAHCPSNFIMCECRNGICEDCGNEEIYAGIGELMGGSGAWGCWEASGGASRAAHGYRWAELLEPDEREVQMELFDPLTWMYKDATVQTPPDPRPVEARPAVGAQLPKVGGAIWQGRR